MIDALPNWLELTALLLALLVLRQNVMVLLGVAVIYCYLVWGGGLPAGWRFGDWEAIDPVALQSVMLDIWDASTREILLSIPLYILAGAIMARGTIATRLIAIMRQISKPVPGGLALATILSCAVFSAISGSSTVTLLAVGAIMYPALLQAGYGKAFALGSICAGGTLGIIIPPSIPLILYGVITRTSIADLFIAGIGPALLLVALFSAYALSRNWHRRGAFWDFSAFREGPLAAAIWQSLAVWRRGIFALLLPVIILGGIYSGYFTPTESAAVAVLAALVIELFIHRDLRPADLGPVVTDTTRLLGSLFPVLALAVSLNTFLVYEQVPQQLVATLNTVFDDLPSFMLAANALLLVTGFFIDIGSAVLILGPLLAPVAETFAVEQGGLFTWRPDGMSSSTIAELARIHFGIMMIVNLEIGYLTPPMGLNLIVAMGAFRESFGTVCRAVVPFILLMMIGLSLIIAFPAIALFTNG